MTTYRAGQFDIAVIGAGHAGIEAALAGARDILAEQVSESIPVRNFMRSELRRKNLAVKVTKAGQTDPEAQCQCSDRISGWYDQGSDRDRPHRPRQYGREKTIKQGETGLYARFPLTI